jgi:FemAB-related protein (PEP-CTERM system-associated)
LNSNGVLADHPHAARTLIDAAIRLADELKVRHLELRHEEPIEHPALNAKLVSKVHMRLNLPNSVAALHKAVGTKVRNQVRKGEKCGLTTKWGNAELVPSFYQVFTHNMRDLGTPAYGQKFIDAIIRHYPHSAEICVVYQNKLPIAAGLLLHGQGITEVPSASSLRAFNPTCANMLLYWNLLTRAIERGQQIFDFGRSTIDSNTYRFKRQWGAQPEPAIWQYYVRSGSVGELRPDNPKYQRLIRIWQRLPLPITRLIGPMIARGIP